jgi:hypothetical protein
VSSAFAAVAAMVMVDTDEYVAFNYYDKREGRPWWCKKEREGGLSSCQQDYVNSIRNGTHVWGRLAESSTVAEHIASAADGIFDLYLNRLASFLLGIWLYRRKVN